MTGLLRNGSYANPIIYKLVKKGQNGSLIVLFGQPHHNYSGAEKQSMQPDHRAAISLNNTGVSLLQKNSPAGALDSLLNAITMMNRALKQATGFKTVSGEKEATEMLHHAAQQLAKTSIAPQTSVASSLNIASDDGEPTHLESLPNHALVLLRIDCMTDFGGSNSIDLELHSSCLLYNYGMAFRIISEDHLVLTSALRPFLMAYSLLTDTCRCSNYLDEASLCRVVWTATLVLKSLVYLFDKLGMTRDRDEYEKRLQHVCMSARELKERPSQRQWRKKAAPAA